MVSIKTKVKRCLYCGRWFIPYPRMTSRQITCGREVCQYRHKKELDRQWWAREEPSRKTRYKKVLNRRRQEGYWKKYRNENSDYVKTNREKTRERMRLLRARRQEAKELIKDPIGQLEALRVQLGPLFATRELLDPILRGKKGAWPKVFATQELLARNFEGMLKFLIAREVFATQEPDDKTRRGLLISGHEDHGTQPRGPGVSLREASGPPT